QAINQCHDDTHTNGYCTAIGKIHSRHLFPGCRMNARDGLLNSGRHTARGTAHRSVNNDAFPFHGTRVSSHLEPEPVSLLLSYCTIKSTALETLCPFQFALTEAVAAPRHLVSGSQLHM